FRELKRKQLGICGGIDQRLQGGRIQTVVEISRQNHLFAAKAGTFYFKDGTAQAHTLTATDAAGLLTTGTWGLATTATKLVITGTLPLTAGVCSAAFTVTNRDSANAAQNVVGATTVTLSGGGS